jgi:hypothetical protein
MLHRGVQEETQSDTEEKTKDKRKKIKVKKQNYGKDV